MRSSQGGRKKTKIIKRQERRHLGEEEAANSVKTAENLSNMSPGKCALGYFRISKMKHNMVIKDSGAQ